MTLAETTKPLSANSTSEKPLRLIALDEDDLAVISANLQDALVPVSEIMFLPKEKRFVLVCKRFDWVKAAAGGCERCATGVHFECVQAVTHSGFTQSDQGRVLNLLAVHFKANQTPGGTVTLTFSGGAAVRLDVECIEAQMSDLGGRWPCDQRPAHALEADEAPNGMQQGAARG